MKKAPYAEALIDCRPADGYLRLVKRFALRPLRSEAEYAAATRVLGQLAAREDLGPGEMDYVAALSQFVGDYENAQGRTDLAAIPPLEVLRELMEQNGMSTTDLGYVVGSRGLASEILHGKRDLSKVVMAKLARRFNVDPGLFLDRASV